MIPQARHPPPRQHPPRSCRPRSLRFLHATTALLMATAAYAELTSASISRQFTRPAAAHNDDHDAASELEAAPWRHPTPSRLQQRLMDAPLTMFVHFSVTTFSDTLEHDCSSVQTCLPASAFNPSNLSTDQWVETARDMGAGEICLTAHHEGGFSLWPSKFSNYTVAASPYTKDIVAQFVTSCAKYSIRPCFYLGPNANGYFTHILNLTADEFVARQLGMTREVLTHYGEIGRLWWDHLDGGCHDNLFCPGGFPGAWPQFVSLVRSASPNTTIGVGPDLANAPGGESGAGSYPVWNQCDNDSHLPDICEPGSRALTGSVFRPQESDVTIQQPSGDWFWKPNATIWTARQVWSHYLQTVGRGSNLIFNMPPDRTGQIPAAYTAETRRFGAALRNTFGEPLVSSAAPPPPGPCSTPVYLELQPTARGASHRLEAAGTGVTFDIVVTREDMSAAGQRILSYTLAYQAPGSSEWVPLSSGVHGLSVGTRVIDVLPQPVTAERLRFQCLASAGDPISLRSISVFVAQPPA